MVKISRRADKKVAKRSVMTEEVYNYGKVIVPKDSNGIITLKEEDRVRRPIYATRELLEILS